MIKDEDDYENLKNLTWKQLRDRVEELDTELFNAEQELKRVQMLEVMVTYVATNYAIYVMASDPENKGGKEELDALRDNIVKEALDYAAENPQS
jgi:hypothetical protein